MKRISIFIILIMIILLVTGCAKLSVAFDAQNETPIFLKEVAKGNVLEEPATPEREGHTFLGWFTDIQGGEKWDFASEVDTDLNLYARWEPIQLTVTVHTDPQGKDMVTHQMPYGSYFELTPAPVVAGYQFIDWFSDAQLTKPWQVNEAITADTEIYSGWEQLYYPIRYHIQQELAEEQYPLGAEIEIADLPKREGYRFAGWNTSEDGSGTTYISGQVITMASEPIDLYAQWEIPVTSYDAGSFHTMVILSDGSLRSSGNNGNGQLGDGTRTTRSTSVEVAQQVHSVSAGGGHTLFIDSQGTLWGVGANFEGQLGQTSLMPKTSPVRILDSALATSAGGSHSMVIKDDHSLWTMGNNEDGQLGDGSHTQRNQPVVITHNVQSVSAGTYHSLFIKTDGSLWAMGWNEYGQLGDGSNNSRNRPVKIAEQVAKASAGENHSLFLKNDGTLWAMGSNNLGQLGDGTTIQRNKAVQVAANVTDIAAGGAHSLYIDSDGHLWGSGNNASGQLLLDTARSYSSWNALGISARSVSAGSEFSLIMTSDGSLQAYGANDYGQLGEWKE